MTSDLRKNHMSELALIAMRLLIAIGIGLWCLIALQVSKHFATEAHYRDVFMSECIADGATQRLCIDLWRNPNRPIRVGRKPDQGAFK